MLRSAPSRKILRMGSVPLALLLAADRPSPPLVASVVFSGDADPGVPSRLPRHLLLLSQSSITARSSWTLRRALWVSRQIATIAAKPVSLSSCKICIAIFSMAQSSSCASSGMTLFAPSGFPARSEAALRHWRRHAGLARQHHPAFALPALLPFAASPDRRQDGLLLLHHV